MTIDTTYWRLNYNNVADTSLAAFWYAFLNVENDNSLHQVSLIFFISNRLTDRESPFIQGIAWRCTGNQPLFKWTVNHFTDAYTPHQASVN